MTGKKCTALKQTGEPCGAYAVTDSEFCFSHDPEKKEQLIAAGQKGGSVTRWKGEFQIPVPSGPLGAALVLEDLAAKVIAGELPSHVANSAGYLLGQSVKAWRIAAQVQRDEGGRSPVVMQQEVKEQKFELYWDFEEEKVRARLSEEDDDKEAEE